MRHGRHSCHVTAGSSTVGLVRDVAFGLGGAELNVGTALFQMGNSRVSSRARDGCGWADIALTNMSHATSQSNFFNDPGVNTPPPYDTPTQTLWDVKSTSSNGFES